MLQQRISVEIVDVWGGGVGIVDGPDVGALVGLRVGHGDEEVVGVEKVRLATEIVTDQQQVTEQVRKEKIEATDDTVAAQPDRTTKK